MASYPAGKYRIRITDQGLTESSNGNPQVILTFDVVGRYDPGDNECYEVNDPTLPTSRKTWLAITQNTAARRAAELQALNPLVVDFEQIDRAAAGERFVDLTGAECDATCRMDNYNGKTQDKWDLLISGQAAAMAPADKGTLSKLKQFRGLFKPAPAPVAAAASGDKIPF